MWCTADSDRAGARAGERVSTEGVDSFRGEWSVGCSPLVLTVYPHGIDLGHGSLSPPPMQGRNMFHPSDLLVPAGLHKSVAGRCRHSSSGGGSSDPDGGDGASGPLPRLAWQLLVGAGVKLLGGDIAPQEGEAGLVAPPPAPRPAGMLGGALGMVRS